MTTFSNPFSVGSLRQYVTRWLGIRSASDEGDSPNRPMSPEMALQISATWACVKLISEAISTMPLFLYKKVDNKRKIAEGHDLNFLLHTQPNLKSTSSQLIQAIVAALMLRGRAYVEKTPGVRPGTFASLEFLVEDRMSKVYDGPGRYHWRYNDVERGNSRDISAENVWYIPNITLDGREGVSPIHMGASSFTGVVSANRASDSIWKKGLRMAGIISLDRTLTDAQREKLRAHVAQVTRDGGFMIMEKGQSFSTTAMTPEDAELLASRRYGVEEVCRWFGVPPFMIGHAAAGQTNWGSGIEQQMIGFVTFVLRPICVRIEQAIRKDLLQDSEKSRFSAEFSMEALLRGDSASRSMFYQTMVRNGIFTRDYCRELENLDPLGGNAAVLTIESNMIPLDKLGEEPTEANNIQESLKRWLKSPETSDNPPVNAK